MAFRRLLPLLLAAPLASGDTLRLASCPQEPHVIGEYRNNGKKCVRNRVMTDRAVVSAECPEGMEYRNYKCRSVASGKKKKNPVRPSCPEGYQLYGNSCQVRCPKGYQQKSGQCILPADALSTQYMTCPDGHRRVDAFCVEDQTKCRVSGAPGAFHYKDGKCERSRQILPRDYIALKKGEEECPPTQLLVKHRGQRYCQDPCPEFYRTRKGKCELGKCVLRADRIDTMIVCPEGKFQVPLVSE